MAWYQKRRIAFLGALLLPLLSSVAVAQVDSAPTQTPDIAISVQCQGSTCDECLAIGCGWFPSGGETKCLKSCSFIADAVCYSAEFSPNATSAEICAAVKKDQVDGQICASANATKDCDSCTSTLQSDGETTCQWFKRTSSCGTAGTCNLLGCGTDTCATQSECEAAVTCGECVVDLDCAWAAGLCLGNCSQNFADAKCYGTEIYPGTNRSEICNYATQDAEIESVCVAQTNCSACVDTEKPDGSGSCEWNEKTNRCGSGGCDIDGECGLSRCNNDTPCFNATSCGECLGIDCAWTPGVCLESCGFIADAPCYSTDIFPDISDAEICDIATLEQNDSDFCFTQTSCENCTSAVLSDGTSTCRWFADDGACCGGGAACDLPGVGTFTCNATTNDTVAVNSSLTPTAAPMLQPPIAVLPVSPQPVKAPSINVNASSQPPTEEPLVSTAPPQMASPDTTAPITKPISSPFASPVQAPSPASAPNSPPATTSGVVTWFGGRTRWFAVSFALLAWARG